MIVTQNAVYPNAKRIPSRDAVDAQGWQYRCTGMQDDMVFVVPLLKIDESGNVSHPPVKTPHWKHESELYFQVSA